MIPNVKEIKVARDFRPGVYVDEFCGRQRTRSSGVSAGLSYRRDGGQETSCTLTSFREQKREREMLVYVDERLAESVANRFRCR